MKKVGKDVAFDLEHEEMWLLDEVLRGLCLNGFYNMKPQDLVTQLRYEALHEKLHSALELLNQEEVS